MDSWTFGVDWSDVTTSSLRKVLKFPTRSDTRKLSIEIVTLVASSTKQVNVSVVVLYETDEHPSRRMDPSARAWIASDEVNVKIKGFADK